MEVKEKEYSVRNLKPTEFNHKPYQANADTPIENQKLLNALNDSLDEVMSYVVDEATRETNGRSAIP